MFKLFKVFAFALMLAGLSVPVTAQTESKVIVNSDGSYSVIEYPADENVEVRLMPMKGVNGKAMAHVHRMADGTKVVFDVNGAPADWKDVYAYAIDPTGASTLLGPITFADGMGKGSFTTPGNQFMLVLSPNEGLTAYDSSTNYVFRSEVPMGYTVVPRGKVVKNMAVVDSTVASSVSTALVYDVPMLGEAKVRGNKTQLSLKFDTGEMKGLEARAILKAVGGKTQITMKFAELQKVPQDKRFILWTTGVDGYTKIGQIINLGKKDTAEIRGETALSDFGLFLTVEDTEVNRPTSTIYQTFTFSPE